MVEAWYRPRPLKGVLAKSTHSNLHFHDMGPLHFESIKLPLYGSCVAVTVARLDVIVPRTLKRIAAPATTGQNEYRCENPFCGDRTKLSPMLLPTSICLPPEHDSSTN